MDLNPFGFGQGVTGGGDAAATPIAGKDMLMAKLSELTNSTTATVLELAPANYDFGGAQLTIRAKNLTIRAVPNVTLNNVNFTVDLDFSDNILLSALLFDSNGGDGARDAIDIAATRPAGSTPSPATAKMRITGCAFTGYQDIAIDVATVKGRPRLLATIDHCLFYDAFPGLLSAADTSYQNRGAINVASVRDGNTHSLGDGFVTVALNVFIDVWRRSPRIAQGNVGHVYNNLLYRWGYTAAQSTDRTNPNDTWRGMEIGGGDVNASKNNGEALIQSNRFIPWAAKTELDMAVALNKNTVVDLGALDIADPVTARPNEFDDAEGHAPATLLPPQPPLQGATSETIDLTCSITESDSPLRRSSVFRT